MSKMTWDEAVEASQEVASAALGALQRYPGMAGGTGLMFQIQDQFLEHIYWQLPIEEQTKAGKDKRDALTLQWVLGYIHQRVTDPDLHWEHVLDALVQLAVDVTDHHQEGVWPPVKEIAQCVRLKFPEQYAKIEERLRGYWLNNEVPEEWLAIELTKPKASIAVTATGASVQ